MMRSVLLSSMFAVSLFLCDGPHEHISARSRTDAAEKMLGQIKSLAGEWENASARGDEAGKTVVSYRITAGGSAVLEIIFPGSEMEMVSVYYRDGQNLVMTHYCMMGNQPRMRAKLDDNANRLTFEFAGGTNLDPAKDAHIHAGTIQIIDRDHVRSEWEYHAGGKLAEKHGFELSRKK